VRKELRKKELKLRKNFLPSLFINFILWGLFACLIYFVSPTSFGAVLLFFVLFFISLLFTFSFLLASSRKGITLALAITIFLILRYFGVGNILNLLLISGVVIAIEIYFYRKN